MFCSHQIRTRFASSVGIALVMVAGAAHAEPKSDAEDAKRTAREAYGRGEAALAKEEYPTAAAEFTHADDLLPNDTALEAALQAVAHTNDARIAMTLLNRVEQRTVGAAVTEAAKRARDKLDASLGRIVVECPAKATCNAELDNAPIVLGKVRWVLPGTHWLRATVNTGRPIEDGIDVKGGALATVPLSGAQRPAVITDIPEPATESPGVSPVYFFIGLGLTAAMIGVSTWSTLDHQLKKDDLMTAGCPNAANTACPRFADEEDSSGKRTLVLWGVTGVLAIATAVTGIFVVRWRSGHAAVGGSPGGGLVGVGLSAEHGF